MTDAFGLKKRVAKNTSISAMAKLQANSTGPISV
jgi:hypothetical protein